MKKIKILRIYFSQVLIFKDAKSYFLTKFKDSKLVNMRRDRLIVLILYHSI